VCSCGKEERTQRCPTGKYTESERINQRLRLREEKLSSRCVATLLSLLILRPKLLKLDWTYFYGRI
jgi:hypothetical protein